MATKKQAKVKKVLREFKSDKLHSGSLSLTSSLLSLLPCPFCSGEPELIACDVPPYEGGNVIQCKHCQASSNVTFSCGDDGRPKVIEAWNKRAEADGLRRQLEAIEYKLADVQKHIDHFEETESITKGASFKDLVPVTYREATLRRQIEESDYRWLIGALKDHGMVAAARQVEQIIGAYRPPRET